MKHEVLTSLKFHLVKHVFWSMSARGILGTLGLMEHGRLWLLGQLSQVWTNGPDFKLYLRVCLDQ